MSYRNDHDAAVARVDALSSEVKTLAAENARLRGGITMVPQAEPSVNRGVAALVLATLAGAGVLAAVVISRSHHVSAPMPKDVPVVVDNADLRTCARALELVPFDADAKATDPRGANQSLSTVKRSTGCRAQIREVLDTGVISDDERATLEKWGEAEAKLDASVSMISEYYAHDPYALDGYSSAPQLWSEYRRALVIRNQTLARWRESTHMNKP